MDVSDPKSVEAAASEVTEEFGKLDIVVNSAGIIGAMVAQSDPDAWWKTYEVKCPRYIPSRSLLRTPTFERWTEDPCQRG